MHPTSFVDGYRLLLAPSVSGGENEEDSLAPEVDSISPRLSVNCWISEDCNNRTERAGKRLNHGMGIGHSHLLHERLIRSNVQCLALNVGGECIFGIL